MSEVEEYFVGIAQPIPENINEYIENWLDIYGREYGFAIIE